MNDQAKIDALHRHVKDIQELTESLAASAAAFDNVLQSLYYDNINDIVAAISEDLADLNETNSGWNHIEMEEVLRMVMEVITFEIEDERHPMLFTRETYNLVHEFAAKMRQHPDTFF